MSNKQLQQIPNDEQAVALRSDAFIKMLGELNTLVNGAYNSNYTARGQNLRPLIRETLRFAQSIFPENSPEWVQCKELINAWLKDEGVGSTAKERKEKK